MKIKKMFACVQTKRNSDARFARILVFCLLNNNQKKLIIQKLKIFTCVQRKRNSVLCLNVTKNNEFVKLKIEKIFACVQCKRNSDARFARILVTCWDTL